MDFLLLAATIGLPLIKFVLFPARAMGRGGNWTLIGAVMIVGLMMAIFFGVQSLTATGTNGPPANGKSTAQSNDQQLPDLGDLSKLL
jgi:hypothetical protein